MVQTVSYSKLLTGLNFVDLLPISFKIRGSNVCHENHKNLYTTKFNMLTVPVCCLKSWEIGIRIISCPITKEL